MARDFDFGDEQRHRDREDSVAERFDSHRLAFFVHARNDLLSYAAAEPSGSTSNRLRYRTSRVDRHARLCRTRG